MLVEISGRAGGYKVMSTFATKVGDKYHIFNGLEAPNRHWKYEVIVMDAGKYELNKVYEINEDQILLIKKGNGEFKPLKRGN